MSFSQRVIKMKIKSYHVYLLSLVAVGMICLPILGSANYWENFGPHSNEAKWEPYTNRYGTCTAELEVRELYSGPTYLGVDEIVDFDGDVYDNTIYIWKNEVGTPHAGRGDDSYLYCYISAVFEYWPGENIIMYVKAETYWNDNNHRFYDEDTFTEM